MNRKFLICLFLFSIFLTSSATTISPLFGMAETIPEKTSPTYPSSELSAITASSSPPPPPSGPSLVEGEYQFDGLGSELSTVEYSDGSNKSLRVTDLDYGEDLYGEVRLPQGWNGYQLVADVNNIYQRMYWVHSVSDGDGPVRENGNFNSIGSQWTNHYSGLGDNSSNPRFGYGWNSNYGRSSTNGVRVWVHWYSGWSWQNTYFNSYRNTVNIPCDNPVSAELTFYIRAGPQAGYTNTGARGRLVIYVQVETKIYRLLLEDKCPNDNTWYPVSLSIPQSDLDDWSVPGNIIVRLGLSWTGYQDSWDEEWWNFDFDDVDLEVKGLADPNDTNYVDLLMNSTTATNAGYGVGTYTVTGTWPNPTTDHKRVRAHWDSSDTDCRNLEFDYNLTLYVTKTDTTEQQTGPDGTRFSVKNDSTNVFWIAYFYAYQPTYFDNYNLTITKPTTETWNIYRVWNPLFNNKTDDVIAASNSTHFILPPSVIADTYGWWNFTLTSTNQVSAITTNFDSFRISPASPSTMTISATLGVTSGQANLTLYDPDGVSVSDQTRTVSGTSVSFTDITFTPASTFPAGEYTLCISYDNGATPTQTSAGFRSKIITVIHDTTLSPAEDPVSVVYADSGTFDVRVQYNDEDISAPISGATVNGTVDGNPITFTQAGAWYIAQIAKNLLDPGNYVMDVDANKTHYLDASTTVNIQVRSETSLTSPDSPGLTVAYDETFILLVRYWDIYNNTGITSAAFTTTGWPSMIYATNGTDGWYEITVDTTDKSEPGTYSLALTAAKTYYQQQTLTFTIIIRARNTQMTHTSPINVPINEISHFTVSLLDLDSWSPITNSTNKLHLDVIYGGQSWYALGRVGISSTGSPGEYNITVDTGYLAGAGSYGFNVSFAWYGTIDNQPFHSNSSVIVYVGVRQISTTITYDPPGSVPWDEDVIVNFNFTVNDPDSQYDGDGITSASFTIRLDGGVLTQGPDYTLVHNGGGQYTLTLLASSGNINSIKSYTLQIQATPTDTDYGPTSRTLSFSVRALETVITYDPPAATPFGENVVITVYFLIDDPDSSHDGEGVINVVSIAGTTLDGGGLSVGTDYTWVPVGGGEYTLTLLYSGGKLNSIKPYTLALHLVSPASRYEHGDRTLTFQVRRLITAISYDQPAATPIGNDVIVVFYYNISDTASSQNGNGITGVTSIAGSTLDGTGLIGTDYNLVPNGNGQYTLTILYSSGKLNNIKSYVLYLYVNRPLARYEDASRTINFDVRQLYTLIDYDPVVPEPWGDDVVINYTYVINDPESASHGNLISGATDISGSLLDGSALTGPDYTLQDHGDGSYTLTILFSSGKISTIKDSYLLELDVASPDPDYEDTERNITFEVRKRQTSIVFDPIEPMPVGEDIVAYFNYTINDAASSADGQGIPGVTSIAGTTLDGSSLTGGDFLLQDLGSGRYRLTIYYSSGKINLVKTYTLVLKVVSPNVRHNDASRTTYFNVRKLGTAISYDAIVPVPWSFHVNLSIHYTVDDSDSSLDGNGIAGVSSIAGTLLEGAPLSGGEYTLIDETNGNYTLRILYSSGKITTVKLYLLALHFVSPSGNYEDADQNINFRIRGHLTQVIVNPPLPTLRGQNTPITLTWLDLDLGGSIIVDANLTRVEVTGCFDYNPHIHNYPNVYSFTLVTNTWDSDTYSLTFTAVSGTTWYQQAYTTIPVVISIHSTAVVIQTPEPTPWGNYTEIVLDWIDLDLGADADISELYNVTVTCPHAPTTQTFYNLAFSLDTTGWPITAGATINITIYAKTSPQQYSDCWSETSIVIRAHRAYVAVTPPGGVPEGQSFLIEISWLDMDLNFQPINPAELDYVTTTGDQGYPSPSATNYSLSFWLSAKGWPNVIHTLNITVYPLDTNEYDVQWGITTVSIRKHNVLVTIDTIPQIPWNNNTWFTMRVNDSDLDIPLNQAISKIIIRRSGDVYEYNSSGTSWTDNVVNISTGEYLVYLQSASWSLGKYDVNITVITTDEYNNGFLRTKVTIRKLLSSFLFTPPNPVPWDENGIIDVHYYVDDAESDRDGDAILSAILTIDGWTEGVHFNVAWLGSGDYRITINSNYINTVTTYHLVIRINAAAEYRNATLGDVPLTVRALITSLTYSQVSSTPFGDNVNVTVTFLVFDTESTKHNFDSIDGATITIDGLDFALGGSGNYDVYWEGAGTYRIEITSTVFSDIQTYHIEVNATWGPPVRYLDDEISSLSFNVRTKYTELSRAPVDAAPYDEDFWVDILFSVRDDFSSQNGDPILGITNNVTVTTNGSWTLNPGDYSVSQLGNQYRITIDSVHTPSIGRWWINISIQFTEEPPEYEEQWIGAYLETIERLTLVQNTQPADTGVADKVTVHLNYKDVLTSWSNDNSTQGSYVRIILLNASTKEKITTPYWIDSSPEPGYNFRIQINASNLGRVNYFFDFNVEVAWRNEFGQITSPFYANATTSFTVRITGTATVAYSKATDNVPFGDDLVLELFYNTSTGSPIANSSGFVGIEIGCADIPGFTITDWHVDPAYLTGPNGEYHVIIHGDVFPGYGSYVFDVNFTWPTSFEPQYSPYYDQANHLVSGLVRRIVTVLDWTQNEDVYYGTLLNLTAWYEDRDHLVYISDANWSVYSSVYGVLPFTSTYNPGDGSWLISVDTSTLPAGPLSLILSVNASNYIDQDRDIDIQLKKHSLSLYPDTPPSFGITVTYLDQINITVILRSNVLNNAPVTGGTITYDWAQQPIGNFHETFGGYYYILLNTSDVNATTYTLVVSVNMGLDYTTPILVYTINILKVETEINIPSGDSTTFSIFIEQSMKLNVTFFTNESVPITDAELRAQFGNGTIIQNFTYSAGGTYTCDISTIGWPVGPIRIIVFASHPNGNYEDQTITFLVTLSYKPCAIQPETPTFYLQWNEVTNITVYLNGTYLNVPIDNHDISFIWKGRTELLIWNGTPGWYYFNLTADDTPTETGYIIKFKHDEGQDNYASAEATIQIFIEDRYMDIEIIRVYSYATIEGQYTEVEIDWLASNWQIPKGDTLVIVVRYYDIMNNESFIGWMGTGGSLTIQGIAPLIFSYSNITGYWTIEYSIEYIQEPTPFSLSFYSFGTTYCEDVIFNREITFIEIPMQLQWAEGPDTELFLVGTNYQYRLRLWDTYHNLPVINATIEPVLSLGLGTSGTTVLITEDLNNPGYYNVTINAQTPYGTVSSGQIDFGVTKPDYNLSEEFSLTISVDHNPITKLIVSGGIASAIILIIAITGWLLWARVFSIPWEVRRLRKLAKKVEKDETFSLSGKDRKRFRARETVVEESVTTAMDTVGVVATPAMLPTAYEVEEVSATEEDIMAELDKIPGLGAEEKAVLAEEMRKIPRKDRIWFLDDLRRQMGQRRMDFLTKREAPKEPPEVPPEPSEEVPSLDEVQPVEPPAPTEPDEERIAPTVLPPELREHPPVPKGVEAEIRRELKKIPGLSEDEKEALVDHLKHLSKEERNATYRSLRQSANDDL